MFLEGGNMVRNISMELYKEKMKELGTSMFDLLTGVKLHDEQLQLIENASEREKLLAMEIVAYDSLKGQAYTNYCRNMKRIKIKDEKKK